MAQLSGQLHKLFVPTQPDKPAAAKKGSMGGMVLALFGLLAVSAGFALPLFWQGNAAPDIVPVAEKPAEKANVLKYEPPSIPDAPDAGKLLTRLVAGTALVLGLCCGTLWMAKRWLKISPAAAGSSGQIEIAGSVALGRRCVIHLLKIGEHQVLAGVDPTGLKSLLALPDSFENALAGAEPGEGANAPSDAPTIVPIRKNLS